MDSDMSARFQIDAIPLTGEIMATAMRLTGSREDAEDLTQEVMLRAYAGFESFRGVTSLKAWLYQILRNTWLNQQRLRKRRADEVSVECISESQLAAIAVRASNARISAEDSALESITDDEVATALAALQEKIRTTVYYAHVLEFSRKEIAIVMDCPIATVISRLYRGRNRLRTSLFETARRRGFAPEQRHLNPPHAA
jgi:RNA polymerase sigma-70 factor, ECF subfamily